MRKPIPYNNDNTIDPTGFKARARARQSQFREIYMQQIDFVDLYGTKISDEDGHIGLHNFYPIKWVGEAVRARYPKSKKSLYCDILRSEHIPFNLFVPFGFHKELLAKVLNTYMNDVIVYVEKIIIEYAPSPMIAYLNDRTSFDVYIEYKHKDGSLGIVGVEVKYTEGDYPLKSKSKEAEEIINSTSLYWKVTELSNVYKPEFYPLLITDRYRQVWRNHMLGESIKQRHPDKYKHFTLVMLYPKGNTHMGDVAKDYITLLNDNSGPKFLPITYQSFLESSMSANSALNAQNESDKLDLEVWLGWCFERYIHD